MLGGEIAAGGVADVGVDVGGIDRLRLAVAVDILEQHLAGEVLALLDDALQAGVGDGRFVDDAVLALEAHPHLAAPAADMAAAQRGRAEAGVVAGIFLIADADMLLVEQANDRGEHGVAVQFAALEIGFDAAAQLGQRGAEFARAFIFGSVLPGAVIGVIAILLAPARILAGRLDMAVWIGAEPGVGVSRGQSDGVQAVDFVAVGDALAVGVEIAPGAADLLAGDARIAVVAMLEHLMAGLDR